MKNLTSTLTITLITFLSFTLQAQDYTQYQLPHPDALSPLFVGSMTESAIYYGDVPDKSSSKPVLVFVHGFIDLANLWFAPGNDIYDKAHEGKYRTAFVATTRGEGMWTNGALLANMLEDITDHYNVNDVVIVAHSNGGKASEVAMFYHDKSHLVNRVISLGTPFKGTGVADLAETPAFNWLVDFIGLGGGTSTSTTYYMEGVARPILDNEPDNQPKKFINFGAWGYDNGTTIAAPLMFVSGELLNNMGAGSSNGGNDGVTPYYSSTRPGGSPQWPGYCFWWWCNNESQYDHMDITFDYVVWDAIKPFFTGNVNNFKMAPVTEEENPTTRGKELESRFELISTMDGDIEEFMVGENAGQVKINFMHLDKDQKFSIINSENKKPIDFVMTTQKGHYKGMNSGVVLNDLPKGTYQISTDADHFAAMVSYEKGASLYLDNSKLNFVEGQPMEFNASVEGTKEDATVTGIAYRKNDLQGNPLKGNEAYVIEFESLGNGNYMYSLPSGMKEGVYNLTINAESDDFRRTIVSGFIVNAAQKRNTSLDVEIEPLLSNYPNPVVEQTTIQFEIKTEGDAYLYLYDAYGRVVKAENVSEFKMGVQQMDWNLSDLPNGNYFLELRNGNNRTTRTVVKLK